MRFLSVICVESVYLKSKLADSRETMKMNRSQKKTINVISLLIQVARRLVIVLNCLDVFTKARIAQYGIWGFRSTVFWRTSKRFSFIRGGKKPAGRLKHLNLIITLAAKLQPYLSREMRGRR